jgi:CelD/BcsL family acetyltransferase involved in cellulose biosynthesis
MNYHIITHSPIKLLYQFDGGRLRTIVVTTTQDLDDYSDRWEDLRRASGGNVYNNLDLNKIWLETYQKAATPNIILIEEGKDLVGIAPLVNSVYRTKGLPLRTLSLVGGVPNCMMLLTNSMLFLPGRKDALELIVGEMKRLKWSVLSTKFMADGDAVRQFTQMAHYTWHTVDEPSSTMMNVPIRDSGDISEGFDKHARRTIKRTLRLIDREGHHMQFRKIALDDLDRAVGAYVQQHIERWGSRGGSIFLDPNNTDFLRKALRIRYNGGGGYAYELLLDGEVAGQLFGFQEGDTAYGYRLGMNDSFSKFSPGWLVFYHAFLDLRERGVRWCAMGGGEEKYKFEMGGNTMPLVGITATRGIVTVADRISRIGRDHQKKGDAEATEGPGREPVSNP